MVSLAFTALQAEASLPTTGANEFNHALASNGGMATASGFNGANVPSRAIDGSPATYWESSTTTGWLAVKFVGKATIDEVHAHFTTTTYKKLSIYLDTDGNSVHETKVWSTTSNPYGLNVVVGFAPTGAYAMKITIDEKVGSNKPKVNEFEIRHRPP